MCPSVIIFFNWKTNQERILLWWWKLDASIPGTNSIETLQTNHVLKIKEPAIFFSCSTTVGIWKTNKCGIQILDKMCSSDPKNEQCYFIFCIKELYKFLHKRTYNAFERIIHCVGTFRFMGVFRSVRYAEWALLTWSTQSGNTE